MNALELTKQSIASAKAFLESDTPAANAAQVVLALVALSPLIVVGAMAPNVCQLLVPHRKKRECSVRAVGKSLDVLDRSGYVQIRHRSNGEVEVHITKKGMAQVRKLTVETMRLPKSPTWDGKWHLFFYDVPVKHNAARLALRSAVARLGMYPLQKSLWIYPYACQAKLLFVAKFFGIAEYINFAIADAMLDEDKILNHFKLKKP